MSPHPIHLAGLLCPLLLVAACGPSGEQRAAWELDQRLQARLAPDIAAGNATLQPLPEGAQVTLLGSAQIVPGPITRSPNIVRMPSANGTDMRADVIEALLAPQLMRVQLADTSALPEYERQARLQDLEQFFVAYGLGSVLQPDEGQAVPPPPGPTGAAPAGLTITISVQCPHLREHAVYDTDHLQPDCR
jgi:hypothetical protein